jgi:hypothetical protein
MTGKRRRLLPLTEKQIPAALLCRANNPWENIFIRPRWKQRIIQLIKESIADCCLVSIVLCVFCYMAMATLLGVYSRWCDRVMGSFYEHIEYELIMSGDRLGCDGDLSWFIAILLTWEDGIVKGVGKVWGKCLWLGREVLPQSGILRRGIIQVNPDHRKKVWVSCWGIVFALVMNYSLAY